MRVLVTGSYGIVGLEVLAELAKRQYKIIAFDLYNFKNKLLSYKLPSSIKKVWGDITNKTDLKGVCKDLDAVIHLAAIIPPLADQKPKLAEKVNVGGTKNLIEAIQKYSPKAKFIFSSSIAVYGDRLANPYITLNDPLTPNPDDHYAHHKIECEKLIKESQLDWVIFRLSYIVSLRKLKMDRIMFDIPLGTCFEICAAADAALALVEAIKNPAVCSQIFHLAGGPACRITYHDYLKRMLEAFGLAGDFIPESAFKKSGFHCGFMETENIQALLKYQKTTLNDYFKAVFKKMRVRRFFLKPISHLARKFVFSRSPYLNSKQIQA